MSSESNAENVPCPAWAYGILGFSQPTRIPCGGVKGHDPPHRYGMTWEADEPGERWLNDRWVPAPLTYNLVDETCPECAARAAENHGAWPCHRCDHTYHNWACGAQDPSPSWYLALREKVSDDNE
jgi:hypothetical protein